MPRLATKQDSGSRRIPCWEPHGGCWAAPGGHPFPVLSHSQGEQPGLRSELAAEEEWLDFDLSLNLPFLHPYSPFSYFSFPCEVSSSPRLAKIFPIWINPSSASHVHGQPLPWLCLPLHHQGSSKTCLFPHLADTTCCSGPARASSPSGIAHCHRHQKPPISEEALSRHHLTGLSAGTLLCLSPLHSGSFVML